MALWDAADLLARCQLMALRPSTDAQTDSDDWYSLLTMAEAHWKPVLATHAPGPMYTAPTLMTTSDSGLTYSLASGVTPLGHMEIYEDAFGKLLVPGAYWDYDADYVQEGRTIRMCRGKARTFSAGPYARYVAQPGTINVSTDSTIQPDFARILLVYHACWLRASRGGMEDPSHFQALEQDAWAGNPNIGKTGIREALKTQNFAAGLAGIPDLGSRWWRDTSLGRKWW